MLHFRWQLLLYILNCKPEFLWAAAHDTWKLECTENHAEAKVAHTHTGSPGSSCSDEVQVTVEIIQKKKKHLGSDIF